MSLSTLVAKHLNIPERTKKASISGGYAFGQKRLEESFLS